MTLCVMGHSGSPSGSVWWIQDRAVTISFIPLPVIGWSGMHHSGCRRTPITSFRPLPCRMRPEIHDGGQSFLHALCATTNFLELRKGEVRRILLPGNSVNKDKKKEEGPGRSSPASPFCRCYSDLLTLWGRWVIVNVFAIDNRILAVSVGGVCDIVRACF